MTNAVHNDRNWIKRILKEERNVLNEMKAKANPVAVRKQPLNYYEEQKTPSDQLSQYSGASKSAIDRAFAREYGDDDLELSSK